MEVEVREARPNDAEGIKELVRSNEDQSWFVDLCFQEQKSGIGTPVIAIDGSDIVGLVHIRYVNDYEYLVGKILPNVPLLHYLTVRSDRQRQGLGRSLIQHAEELVYRRRGLSALALGIDQEGINALDFYRKLGFVDWQCGPISTFDFDPKNKDIVRDYCHILIKKLGSDPLAGQARSVFRQVLSRMRSDPDLVSATEAALEAAYYPANPGTEGDDLLAATMYNAASRIAAVTNVSQARVLRMLDSLRPTNPAEHMLLQEEVLWQHWNKAHEAATAMANNAWEQKQGSIPPNIAGDLRAEDKASIIRAGAMMRLGSITDARVVRLIHPNDPDRYEPTGVTPDTLHVMCHTTADGVIIRNPDDPHGEISLSPLQFAAALHLYSLHPLPQKVSLNAISPPPSGYLEQLAGLLKTEISYTKIGPEQKVTPRLWSTFGNPPPFTISGAPQLGLRAGF